MTQAEEEVLRGLQREVVDAARKLDSGSSWSPTLALLAEELEEDQPFFFRCALASSSRSNSETPVTSS